MRVAVLMGGMSSERDVSLNSGKQVAGALRQAGYEVTEIVVSEDLGALLAALTPRPDAVFNALHGRFGEDGTIQGILDYLGLPYTHSGVRASAVAMDKGAAKAVFAAAGLPVAPHKIIDIAELAEQDPMPPPYVVKPVNEGSSVGVSIVKEGDNHRAEIAANWQFGQAMVEQYIPGRELTVGVLEDHALTVTEIMPAEKFYDYHAKYAVGGSRHELPANVPDNVAASAKEIAVAAHRALGCRGASRADLRYDEETGRLILLEVNTQPGMTATSLLPEQAALEGMDFPALCAWMVERAACRA
ncbi:D-alanine--D-alanine ligase [Acidocella aminolytica]|uniref:D-alanine--D-alanine ligase n=1 Tax=Acidocella aminolytica 101 = DSM 11237 TaxID=1120923 RepID=A0A0D6PCX3_9PROT|nr:D-alanine--D-alanine ligase [Acidocella aminolytica]GAN79186.1 D-alanine--D-alanine ligase [Acidocella aminolytica 101 = DSM 11237]GBQ40743.1 D-alanine--D-alanine ligase [Acidocella aminolytica 101 = DSM 11237]SHE91418.1 D-alanine--D-alanine ligase [Acidocella aminolytica 101 = DSM 11237]